MSSSIWLWYTFTLAPFCKFKIAISCTYLKEFNCNNYKSFHVDKLNFTKRIWVTKKEYGRHYLTTVLQINISSWHDLIIGVVGNPWTDLTENEKETTSRKWPQYMSLISYTEWYDNAWFDWKCIILTSCCRFLFRFIKLAEQHIWHVQKGKF